MQKHGSRHVGGVWRHSPVETGIDLLSQSGAIAFTRYVVADGVFGEDTAEEQAKVDVTRMQAKIGELALANDFLESALVKAGLLSAKR